MPRSRSRTEQWRRTMNQICERGGSLEITLPQRYEAYEQGHSTDESGLSLIWRVRLLEVSDDELVVEEPSTMGQVVPLREGVDLVGMMVVGQNRWMFQTRVLGRVRTSLNARVALTALRLLAPETVERCQRREFYRMSTTGLVLPKAQARALLDAKSAIAAEAATRARIEVMLDHEIVGRVGAKYDPLTLLECGPASPALLVNIGGGGVGLLVEKEHAAAFSGKHKLFWMQIDLTPQVPALLGVVGRLAHTHIDSQQRLYAGMAFEFSHNPSYEKFVVDQLCRCVAQMQRDQLRRRAETA